MRRALAQRGHEIILLDDEQPSISNVSGLRKWRSRSPQFMKIGYRTLRSTGTHSLEWIASRACERRRLAQAQKRADRLSQKIDEQALDVLFGCCISSLLYGLQTDVPIVYYSDATARIINETYPEFQWRGPGYKRVCDAFERATMSRVHLASFATEHARRSAVREYGLDPARSDVVPMGAHLTTADLHEHASTFTIPSRESLRLCIVASDPVRKRVALAVAITRRLREGGCNATLHHIGPPVRCLHGTQFVRTYGALRLSEPVDRRKMARVVSMSHFMLLPSVGEAFGIAPCEAACFGRPSVASDVGGLPEVVQHRRTGLVLPANASADQYAHAITHLADRPESYMRYSRAARLRANHVLNWDAWADGIEPHLYNAAALGVHENRNTSAAAEVDVKPMPGLMGIATR